MTFDESKHTRGGEGTKEGGKFVAKGQGGTPTEGKETPPASTASSPGKSTGDEPPPLPKQGAPAGGLDPKIVRKVEASVERHRPYMQDEEEAGKFRQMLLSSEKSKAAKKLANASGKEAVIMLGYASAEQDLSKKAVLFEKAEAAVKKATELMDKYAETVHAFVAVRDVYFKHKTGATGNSDGQGAGSAQKQGGA